MKKLIFLALCFFSISTLAKDAKEDTVVPEIQSENIESDKKNTEQKFGVEALLTLSDIDSFFNMLPDQIYAVNLDKVYRGEYFKYFPMMRGVAAQNGDSYELECTLMLSKAGSLKKSLLLDRKIIKGNIINVDALLFYPERMLLTFRDTDEYGLYDITFCVNNLLTKESASCTTQVRLEPLISSKDEFSEAEISQVIFRYNTNFDIAKAYDSLFAKEMNFYKKGGLNGFNPLLISFYKNVFESQEFLFKRLDEDFFSFDRESREKLMMLRAFADKEPYAAEFLNREEIIFQNYIEGEFDFGLDPYEGELANAFALEILWGEFFAKGNFKPIARMLEVFKHKEDFIYYTQIADKELKSPSTNEENAALNRGKLYFLANRYMRNYLSNTLLERYLNWTLASSDDENIKEVVSFLLYSSKKVDN